ncbi:MAG TPA: NADH-quinone oxidoreductase subunit NuoH [Elusimicrobia bacterium]|nr:NADH-quinone oxidoreductase subunit NuoH [Elusimicrobiota bacterium]
MDWLHFIVFTLIVFVFVITGVLFFIWYERRGLGRLQLRPGPNRAGPFGLLQPLADAIKVLLKEDIVPALADKPVHFLAPLVAFVPAIAVFAVIPFGDGALLADLNIGILYVVAVSSVATLGVFMAGWGSSNKYSLLGAMRNVAAVVSYEMPLVLAIASVVLIAGSLSLNQIVQTQDIPFILLQPLGFLIFFLAGCAEINRSPFDLLEADSEIVAGFHTEYSGMKWSVFFLAEYAYVLLGSFLLATFFLGGGGSPLPWTPFTLVPSWVWMLAKAMLMMFVFLWVRWTLPRLRVDQLMDVNWKFLLPWSFANIALAGLYLAFWLK